MSALMAAPPPAARQMRAPMVVVLDYLPAPLGRAHVALDARDELEGRALHRDAFASFDVDAVAQPMPSHGALAPNAPTRRG
jgi:hypothetical protein